MDKKKTYELEQNIHKLGIFDIQAYDGELSLDIIQNAICSTQRVLDSLDFDAISAEIAKEEEKCN
ncbi:hypothetical protein [Treponema sp.]|uniref:hypothetical protein n=1 Tax=Treponema sp. TaxID=166 RepID=UPI003FA2BC0C